MSGQNEPVYKQPAHPGQAPSAVNPQPASSIFLPKSSISHARPGALYGSTHPAFKQSVPSRVISLDDTPPAARAPLAPLRSISLASPDSPGLPDINARPVGLPIQIPRAPQLSQSTAYYDYMAPEKAEQGALVRFLRMAHTFLTHLQSHRAARAGRLHCRYGRGRGIRRYARRIEMPLAPSPKGKL